MRSATASLALLLTMCTGHACAADILVTYNLPFAWDSRVPFAATAADAVDATPLTLVGLSGEIFNGFVALDWGPALDEQKYISFSVAGTSTPIQYDTISFDVLSSSYQPDYFGGPDTYFLRYRLGGGTWNDLLTIPHAAAAVTHIAAADISAIGIQSQAVEFGLFGDGAIGISAQYGGYASSGVGGGEIILTGSLVPEPGTLGLFLLAAFTLAIGKAARCRHLASARERSSLV